MKTEILIDEELLRWADDRASETGRPRDDVLEEAIERGRRRSLSEIAEQVAARADLSEPDATALARDEVAAYRVERRDGPDGRRAG